MFKRPHHIRSKANYLRYFAKYLTIFSCLFIVIYLLFFSRMTNLHRNRIIESHRNELNKGITLLDSSIDSIIALNTLITEDSSYSKLFYANEDIDGQTLHRIRKITRAHTVLPYKFIANFGFLQNDDVLFTKEQIYFNRELLSYNNYYDFEIKNFGRFNGQFYFLPATHITSYKGSYEAITLVYCISPAKNTYLFINYSVDDLIKLFTPQENLDLNQISLYYGDTLLVSRGNLTGEPYKTITLSSNSNTSFRVELQLSSAYIKQDLSSFMHLACICSIIVIVVIICWILLILSNLVKPLKRLQTQLFDYQQLLEQQKIQNRIQTLEKALYKGMSFEDDYNDFLLSFPDFPEYWQLVFVNYSSIDTKMAPLELQFSITNWINHHYENFIVLNYSSDTLLLFCPLSNSDSIHDKFDALEKEFHDYSIKCVLGRPYNHYASLFDALQQLEYEMMMTSGNQENKFSFSVQNLQQIYNALQNGNSTTAISLLKTTYDSLDEHKKWFETKYCYQLIAYSLIQLKIENEILDVAIPNYTPESAHQLFTSNLPLCFEKIAERIKQNLSVQEKDLDFLIECFINENIFNHQLCISMITDYLHISAPTLQKRMVARYGKTFSSHIEELRMEKAQQLLRNPSMTIQEISDMVGYTNTNSFYKAYKRIYGHSPRTRT